MSLGTIILSTKVADSPSLLKDRYPKTLYPAKQNFLKGEVQMIFQAKVESWQLQTVAERIELLKDFLQQEREDRRKNWEARCNLKKKKKKHTAALTILNTVMENLILNVWKTRWLKDTGKQSYGGQGGDLVYERRTRW